MYFIGISAVAHKFYGDPLLPLAPYEDVDILIVELAGQLGWGQGSDPEERDLSLPHQEFVRVGCQVINRKLHALLSWARQGAKPYEERKVPKGPERARTRDVGALIACVNRNYAEVSEALSVSKTTVKGSLSAVQTHFNATLVQYHPRQFYMGYWVRSAFARNPIVWKAVNDIYHMGEETKRQAEEMIREEKERREME